MVDPTTSRGRLFYCGWWGETETEKGPVDHFHVEPTDEALYAEETLNSGSMEPIRSEK